MAFWRSVVVLGSVLLVPLLAARADDNPSDARRLLLRGNYAEAAEIFTPLAEKGDAQAAIGLARCLTAQGKYDDALRRLQSVAGDHAAVEAELARLAFGRGDREQAQRCVDKALKLDGNQLLARWLQGELHRTSGRLDKAETAYRWLISYYNDHDVADAESLRWIGLAAAQYARWNRLSDQFQFLVGELYPDALKAEPDYWPAHYEAALLFLEKHNKADAARQLQRAMEINPRAAEVHVALARLAGEQRDIKSAKASIARALELNPHLVEAWLGRADLAWINFQPAETLKLLQEHALPENPVDEATLGRLAACYLLLDAANSAESTTPAEADNPGERHNGDEPLRFAQLVEQVTARNPHPGEFYLTLAELLELRNKLPEAERFYRQAIEVMPRMVGPLAGLGLLCMRAGKESDGRKLLDRAFEADPFNVRVHNTLSVLEVLDGMRTVETDHVVLKFDAQRDKLLGAEAAEHLDRIYPELCEQFGFTPSEKPLIEMFNEAKGAGGHQWFSTRLVGLPYLGTVAACTGPLVAMASPTDPGLGHRFNWARVLRHELVHVITLQQTNFNIPHWYTEGLAVYSEDCPRPQQWNELLKKRFGQGKLFDLDTINVGFTLPNSGDDWQLAYCQAELYVEYMLQRWGSAPQRQLLAAYTEGLTTEQALDRVFGVSKEEFERGYREFVRQVIDDISTLEYPARQDFGDLLTAHRERPEDTEIAVALANAYLRRGMLKESQALVDTVRKDQPAHPLAGYVAARLLLKQNRVDEAKKLLEICLNEERPQPNVLNLLAGLELKTGRFDEAARWYRLGEKLDSTNPRWTRSLAKVYLLAENEATLSTTLTRLAEADPDDVTIRKKLAQLALKRRAYDDAVRWAGEVLHIEVNDADAQKWFAEAEVGRHNYDSAIRRFEIAVELKPDEPHRRFALADACIEAGQFVRAKEVLHELLARVPNYPGADLLMEAVEKHESEKP